MADANTPEISRLEKHQAAPVRFSPIMRKIMGGQVSRHGSIIGCANAARKTPGGCKNP
jgi:hypothetical protein